MADLLVALLTLALVAVVVEVCVRLTLRLRGTSFEAPRRVHPPYLAPHPYLPYAFLPGVAFGGTEPTLFTLHRGRFEFRRQRTNQYRCLGDQLGPKRDGTLRILCLGHSSTESCVWEVGGSIEHSLPLELERYLSRRSTDRRIEVVNCGVGGWTTAEMLVHFALTLLDGEPDVVILYQGANDLIPSLTPGFRSDYSHSRRNLGEVFWRTSLASRLPDLPWWKSYSYVTMRLIGSGNVRHDAHANVNVGRIQVAGPFTGLSTERRNMESLIHLCRGNRIKLILATFAYYVYPAVAADPLKLKLREGVREENEMLRNLARDHGLPLVDVARLIPMEDRFFLDTLHLTPAGMEFLAQRFGDAVLSSIALSSQPRT
ncbi:MAG: SGNH/GDSL hydrolase family protein [Elusimicrobia bacterium]|nr:SGNH/GDSL hydrolase family protein [Elusimicrobiota bacterium]